jgi:tuftelin-interacting protein 11
MMCLGIWADDSGDDDEAGGAPRPSFRGAGGISGKHNYSAPVSFVSGGVQQAGKQKTAKTNESDAKMDAGDDSEDADDENDGEASNRRGRNETPNSSRYVGYYLH